MELLGDVGRVESNFDLFGDGVSVGARLVHSLRQTYHGSEIILAHQMVTRLKWKLVSVHLEIVLILTQDRCMVYAERTIGSEIVLDAPDGSPR